MEVEALVEVLLDELGGPGRLPGGYGVADRVVGQVMFGVPGRRVAVQPRGAVRLLFQPGAQQVGEQLVVAPPAAHLVQRQQEQPGPLHLLEQGLATRRDDGPACRAGPEPRRSPEQRSQGQR